MPTKEIAAECQKGFGDLAAGSINGPPGDKGDAVTISNGNHVIICFKNAQWMREDDLRGK